jgi:hypothetical protein
MSFLRSSEGLYAKMEATAGTSADPLDKAGGYTSPNLTDVRIRDLEVTMNPEKDNEDSKYLTGDYTGDEAIIGKIPSDIKFNIKGAPAEIDSTGGAGSIIHKLNYSGFVKSAGTELVEISDGVTADADYTHRKQYLFFPTTSGAENTQTFTQVSKNSDDIGIATEIIGAVGNLTIGAESAGAPFKLDFEMMGSTAEGEDGVWNIDAVDMAKLKFDDTNVMKTVASKFINCTINVIDNTTASSVQVCSAMISLNTGNTVTRIECQQSKSGYKNALITEMKPRFVVRPQLKTLPESEYWKGITEQHKYSLDVKVDYDDAEGIFPFRIYVPNAQLLSAPRGEDGGIINQELTFRPLRNIEQKLPPLLQYIDQGTGLPVLWDQTGSALEGKEAEAMWYLIIGEEEVS